MIKHLDGLLLRFLLQDDVLDVGADFEHRLEDGHALRMVVVKGHLLFKEDVQAEIDGVIWDRLLPFKPVRDSMEEVHHRHYDFITVGCFSIRL